MGWVTVYTGASGANSNGWSGFNLRSVFPALGSDDGTKVRCTLVAASVGVSVDGCYFGHAAASGDAYDFDGSQTPLTVAGSQSFTLGGTGSVVTDEITYSYDHTRGFIAAFHFNNTSNIRRFNAGASPQNFYFKSAANETATSDVTGYSTTAGAIGFVSLVEVFVPTVSIPVNMHHYRQQRQA